ncbi:MAG: type I-B CRISPR-associated endonuclease Cas1b [Bacteroidota bacterium]
MKKTYYLFNPGRMSRRDNTLKFVAVDDIGHECKPKYLPIEGIENLYIFGSVDANSALFNFLGRKRVSVHFFDYYEHYTGSFQPKEYLLAGKMQVEQTKAYLSKKKRLHLAKSLIDGASHNILRNLKYYNSRGRELDDFIELIKTYKTTKASITSINELMGLEGNIRQTYYGAFEHIIQDFEMNGRHRNPPSNEVNALISFGNIMCYTLCLDMIYHTQLNPTISFLHEPGARRYSLALDLAEVFKPILVDRIIFKVLNRHMIKEEHFENNMNGCFLKDTGRKIFISEFEEKLKETIQHRSLKKKVSYKHLVKLECYKLAKYILKMEDHYQSFKIWW